jgi:arylsulfatase A-like enzyme
MRSFIRMGVAVIALLAARPVTAAPNIVIIFADDLGYGDLGCYGHPTIRTPNLDRLAAEGQRWTDFYVAECVCSPSRAALLTGRLPIRSGMCGEKQRVLFPESAGGLPDSEITLAEALKQRGYATACVGKWHLGHLPPYQPGRHGFDYFFGLPYSNDMDRVPTAPKGRAAFQEPRDEYWNVPLLRNDQVIERPANQASLTSRYTREAIEFIQRSKGGPFFLYMPHTFPHVPLFASGDHKGRSDRGLYGDVVEELDASVGRVIEAIRQEGLAANTMVFFTSDNGPWLTQNEQGGSAGLLRDGKGSTWEGGMRVPCVAWWPGRIKPGVVREIGSTLDLFVTSIALAGGAAPSDRPIDGFDLSPALFGTGPSPRKTMFYYRGPKLYALRHEQWKAHFITQPAYGPGKLELHDPPELYDLRVDPSERFNVAASHPQAVEMLGRIAQEHRATVTRVEHQFDKMIERKAP